MSLTFISFVWWPGGTHWVTYIEVLWNKAASPLKQPRFNWIFFLKRQCHTSIIFKYQLRRRYYFFPTPPLSLISAPTPHLSFFYTVTRLFYAELFLRHFVKNYTSLIPNFLKKVFSSLNPIFWGKYRVLQTSVPVSDAN